MENLVLYRKYRPRSFSEVIGQEHVVKTLTNALALKKVAHAYLFCGPRGTGKTTIARLLAKAVNCANLVGEERADTKLSVRQSVAAADTRKKYEPCNRCSNCQEINDGRALDLIEIDAASNRGIDEIRELREGIKFSPARLKHKVFIIDEVHMLTREAFNALLKTLEEPPEHAIFILATTEIHKVPQTIISRCQRFDFHKLPLPKIAERLKRIAEQEKVKIDKGALELIALSADGAVRDAESLLGQVMAMEDKEITLEEVQTILGTTDIAALAEMAGFFIKKDKAGAIRLVNRLAEEGFDLSQFAKALVNYLRKMMILSSWRGSGELAQIRELVAPELTDEQTEIILEQGQKLFGGDLVKLLRALMAAEQEIKSAVLPQLPLELVIVEFIGEQPSGKAAALTPLSTN
ncbi:MAG: DNA polymerase III subunit gamma/tau [Candidatus Portnoybacteria bacterium]|jgi:DNA polymerase-3 subunit gamma/tau|nr:DNA polymerase III subunit gamma/tau [Candidatus Portnoybacteria bacterium]